MRNRRDELSPEDFYEELIEALDTFETGWEDVYKHEDVMGWVYEQWPIGAPEGANLIWWARSCLHDLEVRCSELWDDGSGYVQRRRA